MDEGSRLPGQPIAEPVVSPWLVVGPIALLTWVWAAATLPSVTGPGGGSLWTLLPYLGCYAVITIPWLIFVWFRRIWAGSAWLRAVWWSVPAAGVVIGMLAATDLDLAARVRLSESALTREVEQHTEDAETYLPPEFRPRQAGLFTVERSMRYRGGVYLFTGSSGLFADCGIAHLPPGTAPPAAIGVVHLYGNWYRFVYYD